MPEKPKPLTEGELEAIRERCDKAAIALEFLREKHAAGSVQLPPPVRSVMASAADVPALLAELERTYDRLTDCWLALDMIASGAASAGKTLQMRGDYVMGNEVGSLGHVAAKTLRLQQAPGWKPQKKKGTTDATR